jgi:16S rRNA (uracil1498-N3)-methyltransferase
MARRRFFVDSIRGGEAELRGEEARRLTRVLRVEPGQRFEISDQHQAWLAEIVEARGERVRLRVIEPAESQEMPVDITLFAALIKFDRFEWMIEKATELGVGKIRPVETARSEKGLLDAAHKRSERWQRVAREASQQARRVRAPEILPVLRWQPERIEAPAHRYFLEEADAPPLLQMLPAERLHFAEVALVIGPEGGWTDAERQAAAAAGWQPVSVGPYVLRAETAALCGLSVVLNAWLLSNQPPHL